MFIVQGARQFGGSDLVTVKFYVLLSSRREHRCSTSLLSPVWFLAHMIAERAIKWNCKALRPTQSNCQYPISAASFLKTDNALCCITKYVMAKFWSEFEGMRDFWTSTRTRVFRFSQKIWNVLKWSAKFQCRPVDKICGTGHAPIQLHASHPHNKSPSPKADAASYKQLIARWAWLDRLHQWSGTLSALWLVENLLLSE